MSTSRSGRPCSGPDRFNGPEGSKSIIASPRLPTGVRYKIVLEAFKEEFLDAAFELLRTNMDPPVDRFEATRRYYEMCWACGDCVDNFFGRMIKETKRAIT